MSEKNEEGFVRIRKRNMSHEVGTIIMGTQKAVEQRWSQRRPVSVPVDIVEHGHLLTTSVSRDIGLGGVFLSLEQNMMHINQEVDLFFHLGSEDKPTKHKLKAKVLRTLNDGAGLMFKDFDTNAFRSLQEIMRHAAHLN